VVRHPDHRHLPDRGVAHDHLLDLGRVGVEAADDEHVLLAVGDAQVAVLVEHPDVAGVQPAVGVDGRGGGLGVVEEPGHDVVAPHDDLAGLARRQRRTVVVDDLHLDVGDGPPGRVGDGLGVVVVAAHGGDAGGLGQAVAGHDRLEGQLRAHPADHLDRDGGRAGDRQPQRGEVVAVEVGVVEDGLVDGGRAGQHGDPLLRHPGHHAGHVEDQVGDDGGALDQAGQDPGLEPEGVEERVDDQVAVALPQAHHVGPVGEGPDAGAVPEHRALRGTGGARGEQDVAQVVRADGRRPLRRRVVGHRVGPRQQLRPRGGVGSVGAPEHHDLLDAGREALVGDQLDVVGAQELGGREQHPGPGGAQHVRGLGSLEPGVERHDDGAGAVHAQGPDGPLPDVGRPDGDAVAGRHAAGHEGAGRGVHGVGELGEAQADLVVDEALEVAEA
jgi:hypothetical protein